MRTLQQIHQLFPASTIETGLPKEAVARSRQGHGGNTLTPLPREPIWKKFIEKFDEPIIKILLGAALLSMFVELFQGNPLAAGVTLVAVVAGFVALFVLKQQYWVPTAMFGSAIIVFLLGLIVPPHHPSIEGLAVMVAVILATGVAFMNEFKSDREFEILNARKESIHVKVIRGGEFQTIPLEEVVVGDHVVLETGDEIPADGRLVKATDLDVDQSLMTGESMPVRKKTSSLDDASDGPDKPGCVYRGTQIVDGVAQLVVTEVGDATYLGQIARKLSAEEEEEEEETAAADTQEKRVKHKLTISKEQTPLQLKLTNLAELISKVGYIAAVAIFLALLVRGLFFSTPREVFWPSTGDEALFVAGNLLNYFVYMVIIIVVAVPEGLPMSVTVSLALAMQKMTRANSLVRQLVACETIGSATVICSDKTGTLTQNKMQVVRLFFDGKIRDRNTPDWIKPTHDRPWPRDGQPIDWLVLNAAVNSTANLEMKEGKLVTVGNSTEGSLLQWLHEGGLEYQKLRLQFEPIYQIHFSSERKRMTTVVKNGKLRVLVKGAPEWVIANTTHYQTADGEAKPWTPEARQAVEAAIKDSASHAMRTLAFGYVTLPDTTPQDEDSLHAMREQLESNLIFIGFVAIRDPLREDVKEAIDECRRAGIEVKMITGDNVETARAIAFDIGLIDRRDAPIDTEDAIVLTHDRFEALHAQYDSAKAQGGLDSPQTKSLQEKLAGLRVLARARPLDKFKMVTVLQDRNEVVAMTGDGTNDAPSLKKADVGLAMGIAGTEVAKEASKIVLLDDSFSTIVKAVHWGRSLYENIQRFIQFQLTINVSALTIAFLGPLFGVRPPFTVLQLLWINVIMDTFAAIALCSEPPRPGVMLQKPKRKDENILTTEMLKTIFSTALFFIVVMMVLLGGMEWGKWFAGDGPPSKEFPELTTRQVSIFFAVYVFFQVWNQINCRSLTPQESGFKGMFHNQTFLMILGTIIVVQVLITSIPGVAAIFKIEPISILDWVVIVAFTSTVLIFAEVTRQVRRGGQAQQVPIPAPATA
jgi:Ca2+-transporting ATPase